MAYLAPYFEHDVFMSYAHGRIPGRPEAPLRDWSRSFIDHLRADMFALQTDIGTAEFWDDRLGDPTDRLTDEIKYHVEHSGVLLIIMSPRYLASDWCSKELHWFRQQFLNRRVSPRRVFVVRAVSTNTDLWPDFLKDSSGHPDIGFQFHEETTRAGIEPFGWPDLNERSNEFNKMLRSLRTTLIGRLEKIRASEQAARDDGASPARGNRTGPPLIYLHTPLGSAALRAKVKGELRDDGYCVAPAVRPATGPSDWQREAEDRIRAAQACDALTLLRPSNDARFDYEFREVGKHELSRINAARASRPLPCAVLDGSATRFESAEFAERSGIALFDLSNPGWRPAFRAWFDRARL
jgi:hypothetical protein